MLNYSAKLLDPENRLAALLEMADTIGLGEIVDEDFLANTISALEAIDTGNPQTTSEVIAAIVTYLTLGAVSGAYEGAGFADHEDRLEFASLGTRTVNDAVTVNGSPTVTSAGANFTAADAGARLVGTGIPGTTPPPTILTVVDEHTITVSANAISAGTGRTLTIRRKLGAVIADFETRISALEA